MRVSNCYNFTSELSTPSSIPNEKDIQKDESILTPTSMISFYELNALRRNQR